MHIKTENELPIWFKKDHRLMSLWNNNYLKSIDNMKTDKEIRERLLKAEKERTLVIEDIKKESSFELIELLFEHKIRLDSFIITLKWTLNE